MTLLLEPRKIVPPDCEPQASSMKLSIIIPTLNEAENLPVLVPRIDLALRGRAYEILVVDDCSEDDTAGVCRRLAEIYPMKLLIRDQPVNGLSGAVLHGFAASNGTILIVMDADLQHPPEQLPEIIKAVESGSDIAIASRYTAGGGTAESWSVFRRLNSKVATLLARPIAGNIRDPMSGFFGISRTALTKADRLSPSGYKIALELVCKCRTRKISEVPFHFGIRSAGTSKMSAAQQWAYLTHLVRLYRFAYPRLTAAAGVGLVVAGVGLLQSLVHVASRLRT